MKQWVMGVVAALTAAISLGLLPGIPGEVAAVAIAGLSALYVDPSILTRCPACGQVYPLNHPPADTQKGK
jgi:hypothetical protein